MDLDGLTMALCIDHCSAFGYLTSTVSSVASSASHMVRDQDLGSKVSSGWSYVQSTIGDPALSGNVKATASSGWSALSTGATAVWRSAQTVVESTVHSSGAQGGASNGFPSQFPRTNADLPTSSKYSGMGNSSRDHDNDSWLDSQLSTGASSKPAAFSSSTSASSSFGPGSSGSTQSNSFSASSSSTASSTATPMFDSTPAPVAPAPAAAPAPAPAPAKTVKKDVDFFGEFGF